MLSDLYFSDLCFQNVVSKMKRDMKELEDQAAASARSAQSEKQHSLQLEMDLKILAAELEQVKESEAAKKIAQKAHNELKAVFDTCRKGIGAMCQHIFGMLIPLPTPFSTLICRTRSLMFINFLFCRG